MILPYFKIFGGKWTHPSIVDSSADSGILNSSSNMIYLVSSSNLYKPLGANRLAWVILKIYAFNKCFSFPLNWGY